MKKKALGETMRVQKKRPFWLYILIILLAVIGIGSVISGAMLFFSPDGNFMKMQVNVLEGSPFKSFLFPGIMLFLFLGIFPLTVVYSLIRMPDWKWPERFNIAGDTHWAWAASWAAGITILLWIGIESTMLGYISFLQTVIAFWSIAVLILTLLPAVKRYYEKAA